MLASVFILAAFVTPAMAMAGAGAASIPILIHLLSKRRYRQIRWAAMEFLLEAERRNRRRVRIEELILLGLRCLAMLLIGLLLARYFIRPEAMAAVLGSSARTDRIVLLDDSFSMGARSEQGGAASAGTRTREAAAGGAGAGRGGPNVFDEAKTSLLRLVKWLGQESPDDSLTIVLTSRPDEPWRQEATIGGMDSSAFEAELGALRPSGKAGRFPVAFESVRSALEGRKGTLSAAVYVISDFQEVDWTRGRGESEESGGSANRGTRRSPASALTGWDGGGRTLRLLLMDVGRPAAQNLTVTSIESQSSAGQAVATVGGSYTVRVANFGETESEPTSLQVFVGDAAQPAVPVGAVGPGQSLEVPVEVTFPNEGYEPLSVELAPDDLPADNTRATVVPVARALRVLVVNGEPSADPYQDEAFLLNVALRPEGPQFSGNEVTVVDENEFDATDLNAYHVVLLANLYRVTEETAARLEQYASSGGGVGIFLGDQVDPELYNRILYRGGKGLLPGRLTEILTAPEGSTGVPLGEVNVAHPAMRRFRDPQVPYFEGAVAYRYIGCEPAGTARSTTAPEGAIGTTTQPGAAEADRNGTVATGPASTRPAEGPRSPAQVLVRLDDSAKSPVLLERGLGQGRVALWTTSVDKEWTNFPERPVYIVFLMELAQYLSKRATGGGDQLVGSPLQIPFDSTRYQHGAVLRLPSFPEEPAVRLEAQPDSQGGAPMIRWTRTDLPGLYRFAMIETSGAEQLRPVAVNVDPAEGDLRHATRGELLASMTGLPVEYVSGESLTREQDTQVRRELWSTLLLALVVVLMSEQALAWWFGGGRNLSGKIKTSKSQNVKMA